MAKEVILLAIHGMGDTKSDFAEDLEEKIADRLGVSDWSQVHFDSIYYQPILQDNQERCFRDMMKKNLDWVRLRRFMLYGFSDATGTERRAPLKDSPYHEVQKIIRNTLEKAYHFTGGPKPVILIAQSLGAQVISNYLWDSQLENPTRGTWKHDPPPSDPALEKFLRLRTLRFLYTTGCNIPIFLAGFPQSDIKAVATSTKGYAFRWKNFYDEDDVLGWPLKPLSPSYRAAVYSDKEVNASGSIFGSIGQAWNPLSHSAYWKDREILKPLQRDLRGLMT